MTGTTWTLPGQGVTVLGLWTAFVTRSDRTVKHPTKRRDRFSDRLAGQQVSALARTNLALTGLRISEEDWQRFESENFKTEAT